MPPISVLMKPASGLCNMRCDYCFYADEQANRTQENFGFMSEKTLKNIIRRTLLHAEGAASFAFQGGEPTLRGLDFFKKAVEYEKQYNKSHVRIQNALQTNGLLLDEAWCEFLRDNQFLVGISLDGVKAVHDRFRHLRGEGKRPPEEEDQGEEAPSFRNSSAFDRVMDRIRLLKAQEVDFNILTVVMDEVVDHLEEIYRFYQEQDFLWQQYIACLDPLENTEGAAGQKDAGADKARNFGLSPEKYGAFLIRLWDLWVKDERRPFIRQFDNWIGMSLGYPPEACDMRGICGIQYVCEADGSVYPCDFYMTDEYRIGNFNTDRIDAVDEGRLRVGFVEKSRRLPEKCLQCEYISLCRGGCRRNRTKEHLNRFCESYRSFFSARLPKLKAEAAKILREKH